MNLSICGRIFNSDDQTGDLRYVSSDDYDQDDHIICLNKLSVVLILTGLSRIANKEDESRSEETQQGQIEDIHSIVTQLPL